MNLATSITDKHNSHSAAKSLSPNVSTNFFKPFVQPKLTINQPNDMYEQEADAVAERVMRMPSQNNKQTFFQPKPLTVTPVQRKCASCEQEEKLQRKEEDEDESIQLKPLKDFAIQRKCARCEEEEKVQMKEASATAGGTAAPSIVDNVINSTGQSLDKGTKNFMESRFGYDFGSVKIHNDSLAHQSSAEINALAYTHGNHVVFGAGKYQPNTKNGKQLLAHELAHVVQQRFMHSETIQEKVIDDDEHVTCRFGRQGAVQTLVDAEEKAAQMADNAALALRQNPISETTRASLWKQFKMDYNKPVIRCRWVPAIAERFEVVADGIRSKVMTYKCTDETGEPHEGCSADPFPAAITRPTLFGGQDISLCLRFWKEKSHVQPVQLLHEWFHYMYQYQGTLDELPGGFDTAGCYHAFAIDVNHGAPTGYEERNCTPDDTPLPPLNKSAVDKVPCPANGFLNISALAGISSLQPLDTGYLTTEIGLDYLLPLGRMHEWELSLGGRFSRIKPSKPEEKAALAVGARVGLTYLRQPWGSGMQFGGYVEGGGINVTDPTGKESTVPYLGVGGTVGYHIPLGKQSSMQIFLDVGKRYGVDTGDPVQLGWFHAGIGIAFQTQ